MKKMLLILALALCSYANAQKGSVLVMGNVSYYSQKNSGFNLENKQNGFGIQPKIGYQFHENWTAGIESNFINIKQTSLEGNKYKDQVYGFGGFVRYTRPLGSIFSAYADLGIGYQNRKETFTDAVGQTYNDNNGFYAGITPAIFIDISKGFGLNFNIGGLNYTSLDTDNATGSSYRTKTFEFNFGQSFSVGLSKNF
ncbi:outer membrane beta-barrel protein [Flavobacterium ginsenosidimutans]|uniref:Outer membrane beta-barrel protein n=1 Tax=Flavobacterium ginsenosidimutans TaxID=687844 RepID=A0ABZ2QDT6_9FLAO|nr:outer membrane beta-barrel protein [Flavobacterium ginsenosidimutans]KAF2329620.1 porin family protein [Flavobacterium ginsenosidimutans]